jgi:hypothetical protein
VILFLEGGTVRSDDPKGEQQSNMVLGTPYLSPKAAMCATPLWLVAVLFRAFMDRPASKNTSNFKWISGNMPRAAMSPDQTIAR